jgi:hypothetical protein
MTDFSYLFKREHPAYTANKATWEREKAAYSGGKTYIDTALVKHVSEIDLEFTERKNRAYYFNYPRKIARIISQFVLSQEPKRENATPEIVEDFSRSGLRVNEVMRQFSTMLNVYGAAWLLVDMPAFDGELDVETKAKQRIRPYAVALDPLCVVDWAYGSDGKLMWAVIPETVTVDSDPFAAPVSYNKRRLWTRDSWYVIVQDKSTTNLTIESEGRHKLGMVPLIRYEETDGYGMDANHWFEDVVRISDAILNNESEAQMNIVKQMFGLLVISESFCRAATANQENTTATTENTAATESAKFSHIIARSAAITETGEENGISRYISPSGAETATIRSENQNLKKELFDVVGLAVQKDSKESQSAESKAWDNQNVQQFLATRADILEQVESQAWAIMAAWDKTIAVPEISYNREFAIIDLKASIDSLIGLDSVEGGEEYTREIARAATSLLDRIKKISPETLKVIQEQIDQITPAPVPEQFTPGNMSGNIQVDNTLNQ